MLYEIFIHFQKCNPAPGVYNLCPLPYFTLFGLGIFDIIIMFLLDLSYRFISRDVDIRNKEIIQKSE